MTKSRRWFLTGKLVAIGAACLLVASQAAATTPIKIETVPIGNPGNGDDTTGYGGVDYSFRMGVTEVTNIEYATFLNAKAAQAGRMSVEA